MTAELPELLIADFARRETRRADVVTAFLDSLTDRERGLVHDAAVMGYVQGLMRDRSDGVPKDSQTMALVIDACLAMPDKYPTVNASYEEQHQTVEYFVECQQPDESWAQCTSASTDGDYILRQRDLKRASMPEYVFRLAQRTTHVIVRVEPTEAPQ